MIDRGMVERAQDPVRNIRRTGYLQKMTSAWMIVRVATSGSLAVAARSIVQESSSRRPASLLPHLSMNAPVEHPVRIDSRLSRAASHSARAARAAAHQ